MDILNDANLCILVMQVLLAKLTNSFLQYTMYRRFPVGINTSHVIARPR